MVFVDRYARSTQPTSPKVNKKSPKIAKMGKTSATFASNNIETSITEEGNETDENRTSLNWENLNDIRVRVKNYGKWYLPPDNFNRNFENLKNVVTPDYIEQMLIKRIKEVKDSYKRDIPNSNLF